MAEGRPSLYRRVPVNTSAALVTDFKSRVLSRLSPAWNSATSDRKRDASKVFEPLRNSIYVKPMTTPRTASRSVVKRPVTQKAMRVLVTPAEQRQRSSSARKYNKQKSASSQHRDPVKKVLSFEVDDQTVGKNAQKLQQLEQKEHQLQEEIANMEFKKHERKRKRTNCESADSPSHLDRPHCVGQSRKQTHVSLVFCQQLSKTAVKSTVRNQSDQNKEHQAGNYQRNPFEPLSKEEIVKRSMNLPSDSDSDGEESSHDKKEQYPLSPLAKDSNCKVINMTTVTHGLKSRVQQTLANSVKTLNGRHNPEYSEREVSSRHTAQAGGVKESRTNKEGHSTHIPRCRDLWSPSRGRVEKTPRRPLKFGKGHGTSTDSSKSSAAKESRPRFSSTVSRSYKQAKRTVISSVKKLSRKSEQSSVDKENVAPAVVKSPSSPVVIRYSEDDPLLKDVFNASIEILNQSIADVTSQFDELESEAQSFLNGSEEMDKENILQQLAQIKKKQEELLRMEKHLQKQLSKEHHCLKRSQGDDISARPGGDEFKRTTKIESGHSAVQRSLFGEKTNAHANIPEIIQKATKLEIINTDMTSDKCFAVSAAGSSCDVMESQNTCTESENADFVLPSPVQTQNRRMDIISARTLSPKQLTPVSSNLTSVPRILHCTPQVTKYSHPSTGSGSSAELEQNSPIDLTNNTNKASLVVTANKEVLEQDDITEDYGKRNATGTFKNGSVLDDQMPCTTRSKTLLTSELSSDKVDDTRSFAVPVATVTAPVHHITGDRYFDVLSSVNQVSLPTYSDTVADEEVMLFMETFYRSQTSLCDRNQRCNNPLASLLEFGDDMHFVPLQEENDSMFVQQEEASKCISCA